jgi:hypothetical protein
MTGNPAAGVAVRAALNRRFDTLTDTPLYALRPACIPSLWPEGLVIFDYPDRSVPDRPLRLQAGRRAVTASRVARGPVTR